jgi:hypothetical protein
MTFLRSGSFIFAVAFMADDRDDRWAQAEGATEGLSIATASGVAFPDNYRGLSVGCPHIDLIT